MTSRGKVPRRRAAASIAALMLVAALFSLPSAATAAGRADGGALSSRLAELVKPSIRALPVAEQARALSVAAEGPGSLLREGDRILVEVRFERGVAAGADDLRAVGAIVVDVSARHRTVTVFVKPAELARLAGIPHVDGVSEVLTPMTAATSFCPSGVAVSEGDEQLRAAEARAAFGVDGSGVQVGLLSDSLDRDKFAATDEAEDVESGDLPGVRNTCPDQATPVDGDLDDYEPGPGESPPEDEGRAMAQIVHDLAPGAQISFATAFTGLTAFAGNIEALAEGGASVIADDVTYFEEPFFQEGPVGVAVSNVTAGGVSYFSSAANNNLISGGRDIASWEAPEFRDSGGCPAGLPTYATHCMDFDPGAPVDSTFGLKVSPGDTLRVDLQWNQPWNGVTTDLDAYLLNSADKVVAESEDHNVTGTQQPFEFLPWKNTSGSAQTVRIAIDRCDATSCDAVNGGDSANPRLKFAFLENGAGVTETEYPESGGGDTVGPTIFGHNGAADATSVGAIRYNATAAPEAFSSRGPVTHYFGPVEDASIAPPLGSPLVLAKPDLVATDGGANTFFGSCVSNTWRFFGTSAAAPHAAAVAALERQAVPGATPAEVKQAQVETAGPVGVFPRPGPAVGAGIVDAAAAISKLKSEPFSPPVLEVAPAAPQNCELPGPPPPPLPPGEEKTTNVNPPPEVEPPEEPPKVRRPHTVFLQHPPRVIRTAHARAKAVFRFGPRESGTTFACRVDGALFHPCRSRLVQRFEAGPHLLRVVAQNAAGIADRTAAAFHFRVERVERVG